MKNQPFEIENLTSASEEGYNKFENTNNKHIPAGRIKMAVYYICYDLRKEKDYKKLTDKLESMGAEKVLLSDWRYEASGTSCSSILSTLRSYIDSDDRLLVVQKSALDNTEVAIRPITRLP